MVDLVDLLSGHVAVVIIQVGRGVVAALVETVLLLPLVAAQLLGLVQLEVLLETVVVAVMVAAVHHTAVVLVRVL